MFKLKKEFSPWATTTTATASSEPAQRRAKLAHPFFEDLTRATFLKMRALAQDNRVLASWTVAGNIRFRLHGETNIRRVKSIFDDVEKIISQS